MKQLEGWFYIVCVFVGWIVMLGAALNLVLETFHLLP